MYPKARWHRRYKRMEHKKGVILVQLSTEKFYEILNGVWDTGPEQTAEAKKMRSKTPILPSSRAIMRLSETFWNNLRQFVKLFRRVREIIKA